MSPNRFENFAAGHVSLTEAERKKLEEEGGLEAMEERVKKANEALKERAVKGSEKSLGKDLAA